MILTHEQAKLVKTMVQTTDALDGRFSLQFEHVSVVYAPALRINPQIAIVHTYATEHFDTPREFFRQYGLED